MKREKNITIMKISKVNHRRTAVALNGDKSELGGILYEAPVQKDKNGNYNDVIAETGKVVNEALDKKSRLYTPFNNQKVIIDKNLQRYANNLKRCYINFVKQYVNNKSFNYKAMQFIPDIQNPKTKDAVNYRTDRDNVYNKNKYYDKQTKSKSKKFIYEKIVIPQNEHNIVISALVNCSLRKSLRKDVSYKTKSGEIKTYNLPELVKKSMRFYCLEGQRELDEKEKYEMYILFSYMKEDKRTKNTDLLVKSISNQNTKVKVEDIDGNKLLKLSIADTKKKPLWEYLIKYADSSRQRELMYDIRKKIILYVAGIEEYENIKEDFGLSKVSRSKYNISDNKMFFDINSCTDKRKQNLEIKIREANIEHYRNASSKLCDDESIFWFQHFEGVIETLFSKKSKISEERLGCAYICDYLWKDFLSYLAAKYIDLGKGVYHFTMKDKLDMLNKNEAVTDLRFGIVSEKYEKGITSFDYERIKAEEELDRNIAAYVTFAADIFAKSVIKSDYRTKKDNNSDVLQYSDKEFRNSEVIRDNAEKNILQYWGGYSRWGTENSKLPENNKVSDFGKLDVSDLCIDIKKHLAGIRNSSVHYTTKIKNESAADGSNVKILFEKDLADINIIYADKYYSNNVWMFYSLEDINKLIAFLYKEKRVIRQVQIPSFSRILKRKAMQDVINEIFKDDFDENIVNPELKEKYRNSLYFMLKEIYYNAFIIQPELKEKFKDKIKIMKSELYNKLKTIDKKEYKALYCMLSNEESALKNFADRIYSVDGDNVSFADICKILMTDYNMQNQEKKNIESMEQKKKNKGKDENYKHFPLLLHKVLKELFIEYLKQTHELEFLRNNICIKSDVTMESFESQIKGVEIYKDLKEKIDKNNSLLDWYVIAHFLMPKQLNHLIGNIKNYIQFATNIDKRAESVKNLTESGMVKRIQYYDDIVRTLEFSAQYIGKISNNINDYFNSEDEYVSFLSKYVGFINDKSEDVLTELKDFCREKINNGSQIIGIYYGGDNVIINRNVIYAQMYSNAEVFSNIYKKVTKNDIINYYEKQNDLKDVFKSGVCQNEGEQRSLCEFQQLKNRIELTELSTYADMVNDFMAQFVEWAYLRERDLMYFQLGIHYIRLFYSDNALDEKYHKLSDNVIDIEEGALLYQIVAMYDYELRIFETDNSGNAKRIGQGGPGKSIPVFLKKYCNGTDVYECGLELFEDINQHEHIIRFRNDIAHMRYMSNQAMNIMSIVSNIYKSFFVYDMKLKKSISLVFKNILMRYGVIADLVFSYNNKNQSIKDDMDINIINIKNLKSDKYVYKIVNEDIVKQVEIEIRNQVFLEQLHNLLYFSR